MRLSLVALLLVACTTVDRRRESTPDDFAFAPTPADFQGAAPCAAAGGCYCCCDTHPCVPGDLHPCQREWDAAVCPGCEVLDMLELSAENVRLCNLCLAGDVDAGVACSIAPN